MFSTEVRDLKSECWESRWRGVGNDGDGRPTHYVPLTTEEMVMVAATGHVSVPDHAIPEQVRTQRELMVRIAGEMGVNVDAPNMRDRIARFALEEMTA